MDLRRRKRWHALAVLLAFVESASAATAAAPVAAAPSARYVEAPARPPARGAVRAAPDSATPDSLLASIEARFRALCYGLDASVEPHALATLVCDGLNETPTEQQVTALMAETAAYQASMHNDFARVAARVTVAQLHERTAPGLLETLRTLHAHEVDGQPAPLVSDQVLADAEAMAAELEAALLHERDFDMDYFGLRTLQRAYLLCARDGTPIERPQHLLMRVALCVHGGDRAAVLEAYDLMSRGFYTHATPTMFNAGAKRQQLSSCFLLTAQADSVAGIFDTLRQCALISRDAGGIGLSVSHIR
eukprot:352839-Prymnesium_polylepis.1